MRSERCCHGDLVQQSRVMCTMLVFDQKFALEAAIGSHACSLKVSMRMANTLHLGGGALLTIAIINSTETLKAFGRMRSILC
jgi:hypothetical protein